MESKFDAQNWKITTISYLSFIISSLTIELSDPVTDMDANLKLLNTSLNISFRINVRLKRQCYSYTFVLLTDVRR